MVIINEEFVRVNITNSSDIHEYYMYLISKEKQGYVIATEIISEENQYFGTFITFKVNIDKYPPKEYL